MNSGSVFVFYVFFHLEYIAYVKNWSSVLSFTFHSIKDLFVEALKVESLWKKIISQLSFCFKNSIVYKLKDFLIQSKYTYIQNFHFI